MMTKANWKKRLFVLVLAFVFVFGVFSFAACGNRGDGSGNNPGTTDQEKPGDKDTNKKDPKLTLTPQTKSLECDESDTLTATVANLTEELVWASSDNSIVTATKSSTNERKCRIVGVKVGTATVSVSANGLTASCEVTVTPAATIALPSATTSLKLLEKKSVNAVVENTTQKPTWTTSDNDIVAVKGAGNSATLTGAGPGAAVITARVGKASASMTVTVESKNIKGYLIYGADGEPKETTEYNSMWAALNYMFLTPDDFEGCTLRDKDDTDFVAFSFSTLWLQIVSTQGTTWLGAEENTWGGKNQIDDGKITAWTGGFSFQEAGLYTTESRNTFTVSGGINNDNPYLVIRPTDWKTPDTDGEGSYAVDPASNWSGWRASLLKQASTGAQYVGAVNSTTDVQSITMTLDFSGATMAPSENANQPAVADIVLGTSSLKFAGVNEFENMLRVFGLTFDAGTTATTAELEDGAQQGWYISYIENVWIDGESSYAARNVTRTTAEEPSFYSTWDAAEGVWKTPDTTVTLTVSFIFTDDGDGTANYAMKCDVSAVVGEEEAVQTSVTHEFEFQGSRSLTTDVRFAYGVYFGPKYTDEKGNTLADLQCGASWKGFELTSVVANTTGDEEQELGFMLGRNKNLADFVGVWGCDVLTVEEGETDGSTVFDFEY